jgi:hypothetical protein
MKAEDKAKELVEKNFMILSKRGEHHYTFDYAKQCALIAVDEMLDFRNGLYINEGSLIQRYLLGVKQEIEKL